MRLGSRDFWFLKKRVRAQTPRESRYLMRVGKRGRTLKFLRSAMESSSRLNYSTPILRVHPSRKPNSSVRITLASLSTRSITPAIRKEWKSVITQLQCTRTSCRWKSLLQAQNWKSRARQLSRSVYFSMKLSSAASWCGFMLKGMISLIDSPIRFEGMNPSTPGRFLEIRTILPISSSTLTKTTVVFSEKSCSFSSFCPASPCASRLHLSISLRNWWSWQNSRQTWASRNLASGEYSLSYSMLRRTALSSTNSPISRCTLRASTCFRPSRCCRNLKIDTASSAARRRFSRKRTMLSSKTTTSSALAFRTPPRFRASSSVHFDFRISISNRVRWLLFFRERMISYRKTRTQARSLNSRLRSRPRSFSPSPPAPSATSSHSSPLPPLALPSSTKRAAVMVRKRQCYWPKLVTRTPRAAMRAARRTAWWVFWLRSAQKGKQAESARRSPMKATPSNSPATTPLAFTTTKATSVSRSSTMRQGWLTTTRSSLLLLPKSNVWYSIATQFRTAKTRITAPAAACPGPSCMNLTPSDANRGRKTRTKLPRKARKEQLRKDSSQSCLNTPFRYF